MRPRTLTLGRAFWMACGCFLLLPHLAIAAKPSRATDVDGRRGQVALDHREPSSPRPELIASYRLGNDVPLPPKQPNRRSVDDLDTEMADVMTSTAFVPVILPPCASPRAPALEASDACGPGTAGGYRPFTAADPFAPRPPPPHLPL